MTKYLAVYFAKKGIRVNCLSPTGVYNNNPEDFVISEIEQGQITFENEQIAEEYNAALKRLRIRRLTAMSYQKKFSIFIKSG